MKRDELLFAAATAIARSRSLRHDVGYGFTITAFTDLSPNQQADAIHDAGMALNAVAELIESEVAPVQAAPVQAAPVQAVSTHGTIVTMEQFAAAAKFFKGKRPGTFKSRARTFWNQSRAITFGAFSIWLMAFMIYSGTHAVGHPMSLEWSMLIGIFIELSWLSGAVLFAK